MRFNPLIPELTVSNLERSLTFYVSVLTFRKEFERRQDNFAFLSYKGSQLMLIQDNGDWITGEPVYPRGRGINFEIETDELDELLNRINTKGITLFREPVENRYETTQGQEETVIEFLVQDPDGYLLRFQQVKKYLRIGIGDNSSILNFESEILKYQHGFHQNILHSRKK